MESILQHDVSINATKHAQTSPKSPNLLPAVQITPDKNKTLDPDDNRLRDGLGIERPRSALHSGDFTSDETGSEGGHSGEHGRRRAGERLVVEDAWLATSPPRHFSPFDFERRNPLPDSAGSFKSGTSPLSSSFASSFVYQPPTTPLVQSESNEDLDHSMPLAGIQLPSSHLGSSRRHTLTSTNSSPFASPSSRSWVLPRVPTHRREGSHPYQAHQPRRSLTSTPSWLQQGVSPQTPSYLRSRRPSFSSDTSPIQHASMVGSYEESILRGRMSTTPSKPFDFLAQIGVLGKGKCKSSLRCPPHVTLPFPAVYYSYGSSQHGRLPSEDGPSPYVGQIDLENGLPNPEEESRSRRKAQSRYTERKQHTSGDSNIGANGQDADHERTRATRPKRRSGSPKAPPGGSYRIPEKGQIQIIVKNQNKTAVKLFLVPYDLTGIEPGTKTFIRQRSYSAGPIIDDVPNMLQADPMSRPTLRYLVHLHICCPSKGRYYLYKSIRIVFANRVPDGKEKLRNETTWPEPRFTPYRPIRVMHPPLSTSNGPGAMLTAEKAYRRRSLGFPVGAPIRPFDGMVDDTARCPSPSQASIEQHPPPSFSFSFGVGNTNPIEPMPLRLPARDRGDSDISDSTCATGAGMRSPQSPSQASRPSTKDSFGTGPWGATQYEKLNKGDLGYGGNVFNVAGNAVGPKPGAEGLLSQRLRSLDVRPQTPTDQDI